MEKDFMKILNLINESFPNVTWVRSQEDVRFELHLANQDKDCEYQTQFKINEVVFNIGISVNRDIDIMLSLSDINKRYKSTWDKYTKVFNFFDVVKNTHVLKAEVRNILQRPEILKIQPV